MLMAVLAARRVMGAGQQLAGIGGVAGQAVQFGKLRGDPECVEIMVAVVVPESAERVGQLVDRRSGPTPVMGDQRTVYVREQNRAVRGAAPGAWGRGRRVKYAVKELLCGVEVTALVVDASEQYGRADNGRVVGGQLREAVGVQALGQLLGVLGVAEVVMDLRTDLTRRAYRGAVDLVSGRDVQNPFERLQRGGQVGPVVLVAGQGEPVSQFTAQRPTPDARFAATACRLPDHPTLISAATPPRNPPNADSRQPDGPGHSGHRVTDSPG